MNWQVQFIIINLAMIINATPAPDEGDKDKELPSKIQQRNLIESGKELCSYLRNTICSEAHESKDSLQKDADVLISRAMDYTRLLQENYILKLSCESNSVKSRDFHDDLKNLTREFDKKFEDCKVLTSDQANAIANGIQNDISMLEKAGMEILNDFLECSKKPTWSMFACYKKISATRVTPLKDLLRDTVDTHSRAHTDFIKVKNDVLDCVNERISEYKTEIASIFQSYRH